jgi:hypothetical protein
MQQTSAMQRVHATVYRSLSDSNIFVSTLFLNTFNLCFSPHSFTGIENNIRNDSCCALVFGKKKNSGDIHFQNLF